MLDALRKLSTSYADPTLHGLIEKSHTPPAKAGGFRLRVKAGLIGKMAGHFGIRRL